MTRLRALALLSAAAVIGLAVGCMSDDAPDQAALVGTELPNPECMARYREVEGLGTACPLENAAWKVRLDDGGTVITHGQDAKRAVLAGVWATKKNPGLESVPTNPNAGARGPACTQQNPKGNYHFLAIIAWPSGVTPNKTPMDFRYDIYLANYVVWKGAVDSGSPMGADLVFACEPGGFFPRVELVPLSFTKAQATFGKIISELQAKGYNKANEKYVVWYDEEIPPTPPVTVSPCGEATGFVALDETAGVGNANNIGPSYGLSYDCGDGLLHELAHNLGAVQRNAPQATSWWHCWEEEDVMCYDDNWIPSGKSIVTNCVGPTNGHLDCKHDDYFDAAIGAGEGGGPGSYLDAHWNLAGCYVRFVVNYATVCKPAPPQLSIDIVSIALRGGLVTLTFSASPRLSRAAEFVVLRDNHPVGRVRGEPGTSLRFVDEQRLVPGETYDYRIVGVDGEGEFDSNSNVVQATGPD